jgi:hypothetical protein
VRASLNPDAFLLFFPIGFKSSPTLALLYQ